MPTLRVSLDCPPMSARSDHDGPLRNEPDYSTRTVDADGVPVRVEYVGSSYDGFGTFTYSYDVRADDGATVDDLAVVRDAPWPRILELEAFTWSVCADDPELSTKASDAATIRAHRL